MEIDIQNMGARFAAAQAGKASLHSAMNRLRPSIAQYDFLALDSLSRAITTLIGRVPKSPHHPRLALDLGCDKSPYRDVLERAGFVVKTLDLDPRSGADYNGSVEATGLPDGSFDLVLCTQVLEHCDNPWRGIVEISRILTPQGYAILSVPHVWFYHPHPHDHWRFTQEGVVRLCREGDLIPQSLMAQGGTVLTVGQVLNFVVYGIIGRWGAPFYCVVNAVARFVDRLAPNELFAHNFACLACRTGSQRA